MFLLGSRVVQKFISLLDTFTSYAGKAGEYLRVKATEDGVEASGITLDTDGALTANSDLKIASQKATKTYADTKVTSNTVPELNGIKFPATQVPSSDANTLDDYEEGSWTPELAFGGLTTGITYLSQIGHYTKIGNIVVVTGGFELTSKGSAVGNATIINLPFTVVATDVNQCAATLRLGHVSFANQFMGYASQNATVVSLNQITEAGVVTSLDNTNFTQDSNVMVTVIYRVK